MSNKNNTKYKFTLSFGIFLIFASYAIFMIRCYFGDDFFVNKQGYFPPASHFLQSDKKEFEFAVISDTESNTLVLQNVAKAIMDSGKKYEFVLHLGDILGEYSESHFYWMAKKLSTSLNGIQFFAIPGNHDVFLKTKVNKEQYTEVFGPTYYWFGYGDVLFIGYDSSETSISDEQIQWLSDTLTKIRPLFKYCIIYSHVPPINPPDRPRYKLDDASALKLEKVLRKHKVNLLLFGHVHYFSKTTFAGVPVYTLPPSGQRPRPEKEGYGYVSVSINKNGIDKVENHLVPMNNTGRKEKKQYS